MKDFFIVKQRSLKLLAALVWYTGSIALFLKATSLLLEAKELQPENHWLWIAVVGGIMVGTVKGELLFKSSCQKNLARINRLECPYIWQIFKPSFFLFMVAMVTLGATLSNLAHNNHPFLLTVAFIDLSIAVALLWSSRYFWR